MSSTLTQQRRARGDCSSCGARPPTKGYASCKKCRTSQRAWIEKGNHIQERRDRAHSWWVAMRQKTIDAYGGKCACCGVDELVFLAIDHLDGLTPEGEPKLHARQLYAWLRDNNYPPGFQVLCHNCNMAIVRTRVCPHRNERKDDNEEPDSSTVE